MCSGCAFLDYDNDGWMDILLVNTGPSEFYHPVTPAHKISTAMDIPTCTSPAMETMSCIATTGTAHSRM
jgi:hypothetical protein